MRKPPRCRQRARPGSRHRSARRPGRGSGMNETPSPSHRLQARLVGSRPEAPLTLALLALLALPRLCVAQVGVQVEAGLDGLARVGRWAPVRVTAANNGSPVVSRLEVIMPGARTELPLELPTSANKRVAMLLIPQPGYDPSNLAGEERARVVLRQGRTEIAQGEARLRVLPAWSRLLAVCGEDAGSLRFLDGLPLAEAGWTLPLDHPGVN